MRMMGVQTQGASWLNIKMPLREGGQFPFWEGTRQTTIRTPVHNSHCRAYFRHSAPSNTSQRCILTAETTVSRHSSGNPFQIPPLRRSMVVRIRASRSARRDVRPSEQPALAVATLTHQPRRIARFLLAQKTIWARQRKSLDAATGFVVGAGGDNSPGREAVHLSTPAEISVENLGKAAMICPRFYR